MNKKQKQFALEYLIDLNATQAAIRAGYSPKTASQQGCRLLINAKVQKYIQNNMDKRAERTEIAADRVLEELAKLGFSNILDYLEFDDDKVRFQNSEDIDRVKAACISEVSAEVVETLTDKDSDEITYTKKLRLKLYDKKGALELIGKHLKLFTDKIDLGGQSDNPLHEEVNDNAIAGLLKAHARRQGIGGGGSKKQGPTD